MSAQASVPNEQHGFNWRKNMKFIMLSIPFMAGYSALQNLQRYMKEKLHADNNIFGIAYGFLYIGNMIFRLFHNIIFCFTKPYWRIIIAYGSMIISMSLMLIIQAVDWNPNGSGVWIAFVTFAFGGVGVGNFCTNTLNVMSLISSGARFFTTIGIPIGVNFITIFSFLIIEGLRDFLTSAQVCIIIFILIIALILVSLIILLVYVPHGPFIEKTNAQAIMNQDKEDKEDVEADVSTTDAAVQREKDANDLTNTIYYFPLAFKNWRDWFPQSFQQFVGWFAGTFTNTQFSPGIVLYTIHPNRKVNFFGIEINANYYRSILAAFTFVADFFSRLILEKLPYVFPPLLNILNLVGTLLVISGRTECIILGVLLITFSNGSIYQQTTKYVREVTAGSRWNLITYSFWLFSGDVGSVLASFTQQPLSVELCVGMRNKIKNTGWDPCPYYDEVEN